MRPFLGFALPLVAAMRAGNEFEAINILRAQCPRLQPAAMSRRDAAATLSETRAAVRKLCAMLEGKSATIRDLATLLREESLLSFDEQFDRVLSLVYEPGDANGGPVTQSQPSDGPVTAFLGCPAHELWPYQRYVSEGSPFATQQGVKGAEFDRVIVVMDEEESDYNLYDFEQLFGVREMSAEDRKKMENGEDTGWSRTLRLLYVSCTRARRGLVLAFFVGDPEHAVAQVLATGILPSDAILTRDALSVG